MGSMSSWERFKHGDVGGGASQVYDQTVPESGVMNGDRAGIYKGVGEYLLLLAYSTSWR